MSTMQSSVSVQNDGNFSHLDFFDPSTNMLRRIEVFRGSQPEGAYGVTAPGSNVKAICGSDHLTPKSNRIYRSLYSEGQKTAKLPMVLELREEKNLEGLPDGSWDVRIRDLDFKSETFGSILHVVVIPIENQGERAYQVKYELRSEKIKPIPITSPLGKPINEIVTSLPDISISNEYFNEKNIKTSIEFILDSKTTKEDIDNSFAPLHNVMKSKEYSTWRDNIYGILRLGNLGPKSVHPAVNLIGNNPGVVAESVTVRGYRSALILSGRAFGIDEMTTATKLMTKELSPGINNSLPGVYNYFILAYKLNISLYQLILDKVESDYGGVPMALKPGSRLETNRQPIIDATQSIKTMADIAEKFYLMN
ncbi:hypothetical protein [Bacillus sp. K2I17]|uniref:hypothetical protein n=1 Tax=Bacillus sp. K2I17 TaxID=2014743 RepID=UPI000B51CC57|nr:hypothetical protein [Bacillus sp. K2I17]OWT48552.1 hypothetical protein CER22_24895 [Bacillus sp. K2I17]